MLNPYIKRGISLPRASQMGAPAQQSCAASAWEKAGEMPFGELNGDEELERERYH
jgi:hypothetical protein